MSDVKGIVKKTLGYSRDRVVDSIRSGDTNGIKEWKKKTLYLRSLHREINSDYINLDIPKRVFVAYSKSSGSIMYSYIKEGLEDLGYEVVSGFEKSRNRGENTNIISTILDIMSESSVYLSIMTKEHRIVKKGKDRNINNCAPSSWIGLENGIAISMNKPVVFMVEECIDESFWRRVLNADKHYIFNDQNAIDVSRQVIHTIDEKYKSKIMDMLMKIDDDFYWASRRGNM